MDKRETHVGGLVREYLLRAGMSEMALAAEIGISRGVLNRYMYETMPIGWAGRIAVELGIDLGLMARAMGEDYEVYVLGVMAGERREKRASPRGGQLGF